MNTITLNSNAVMNYFIAKGVDKENQALAMAMYDAAHKYENAVERIATLSKRLHESIEEIAQGRVPTWTLSETARTIEKYVAEKKEAENLFNLLAKLNGYTIEA